MASSRINNIFQRFKVLKNNKQSLTSLFQLISEYVYNRKYDGQDIPNAGIFADEDIYDNTAQRANGIMANVMVNNIWPNGPRTFSLGRTWDTPDTEEVKTYFSYVNQQMYSVMDNTKAGLQTALDEYMLDQGAFATSGIYVKEKEDDRAVPVRYEAWSIKGRYIDEGPDGNIDTIFSEISMSVRNAVKVYGYENLSARVRKDFDNGDIENKVKILHVIEPRLERDKSKKGVKDMPIASIHIEVDTRKILKESGMEEMPVFIGRFSKVPGEIYGRSPAMVAMADILEINAVREAISIATEKQLDPPMAVYDDGALGAGAIDTSAGAINVFSVTGRLNAGKPIEPLYTVGELQSSYTHIDTLKETINNHFYLDRLLDFNNETRMTLGEAQLRNALRGQSLGAFYARQENEVITPMIERTFNILLKLGRLGVIQGSKEEVEQLKRGMQPVYIPEELVQRMMNGEDFYEITYLSPAKRTMQSEELRGIIETANFAVQVAPTSPEIIDNIDFDKLIARVAKLSGAPMELIKDSDTVKKIREARAKQQKEIAKIEQARQQSEIGRNVAQMNAMQKQEAA
nr:MAG TPA: head to tail connecting protein [Caudoviricetes sp.]